ncbi:hypothetical protein M3J09_005459 [Ascochyta lentis]
MSSTLDITESLPVSARNTPAETGKLIVDLPESSDDAMNLEDDDIPKMIKVRPLPTHGNRDSTSLKSSSASVTHMPLSHTYYENEISRKEYEFGMCRKELEDAYDEIMVKDRRI